MMERAEVRSSEQTSSLDPLVRRHQDLALSITLASLVHNLQSAADEEEGA